MNVAETEALLAAVTYKPGTKLNVLQHGSARGVLGVLGWHVILQQALPNVEAREHRVVWTPDLVKQLRQPRVDVLLQARLTRTEAELMDEQALMFWLWSRIFMPAERHEVAEWLQVRGKRVWAAHPGQPSHLGPSPSEGFTKVREPGWTMRDLP